MIMVKGSKLTGYTVPSLLKVQIPAVLPKDFGLEDFFDDDIECQTPWGYTLRYTKINVSCYTDNIQQGYVTAYADEIDTTKRYVYVDRTVKHITTSWENNVPPGVTVVGGRLYLVEEIQDAV